MNIKINCAHQLHLQITSNCLQLQFNCIHTIFIPKFPSGKKPIQNIITKYFLFEQKKNTKFLHNFFFQTIIISSVQLKIGSQKGTKNAIQCYKLRRKLMKSRWMINLFQYTFLFFCFFNLNLFINLNQNEKKKRHTKCLTVHIEFIDMILDMLMFNVQTQTCDTN